MTKQLRKFHYETCQFCLSYNIVGISTVVKDVVINSALRVQGLILEKNTNTRAYFTPSCRKINFKKMVQISNVIVHLIIINIKESLTRQLTTIFHHHKFSQSFSSVYRNIVMSSMMWLLAMIKLILCNTSKYIPKFIEVDKELSIVWWNDSLKT